MRGRESELEAANRLLGEPSFGLLGDVRGMIVEDQLDCRMGRIGGVEKLKKFDEFATAVAVLNKGVNLAGQQIDPGQQTDGAVTLVSRAKVACTLGSGGRSGAVVAIAWIPGFSS